MDVGATFGTNLSNTYLLERDFGWRGICVEPYPAFFQKLIKNRSSRAFNFAAYNQDGLELSFVPAGFYLG